MKFSELQRVQRMAGVTVTSVDDRIAQLVKERDALRAELEEQRVAVTKATALIHSAIDLAQKRGKERESLRAELASLKAWKEEVEKQEPVPCDLCEDRVEEVRSEIEKAIRSHCDGADLWLSANIATKNILAAAPKPEETK